MGPKLEIITHENDTKALVRRLYPQTTENDLRYALGYAKVTNGIQWEQIIKDARYATESNTVLENVLIAQIQVPHFMIRFGKDAKEMDADELEQFKSALKSVYLAINRGDIPESMRGGIFLSANEPFLNVQTSLTIQNVFGTTITLNNRTVLFNKYSSVNQKVYETSYDLIAAKAGYLALSPDEEIMVLDPFEISPDKLELYCFVFPLAYGRDSFMDKLFRCFSGNSKLEECTSCESVHEIMAGKQFKRVLLRRGFPPERGHDGKLVFDIDIDYKPVESCDGKVDFKNINRFKEISKGTIVARRIPAVLSRPGLNVLGEIIPVEDVKENKISYGKNILEEDRDGEICYIAEETGILVYRNNFIEIEPDLHISGDVGVQTGNIKYSRNVTVHGNVCSGFRIECGGNLTIQDGVEDGVELVCTGNLNIAKGLFGERSKVTVSGSARIGFIQNSYLRVKGDLIVREYIYQSEVYCGGRLLVEGYGIDNTERGCVIGGKVCSIKSMEFHSAGSIAALTTLFCGMDPEIVAKIDEISTAISVLKKRIAGMQNKIGYNLSDKKSIEMLRHLPEEKKLEVAEELKELKKMIETNRQLEDSLVLLRKRAFAEDCDELSIIVKKHLIPQLLVIFRNLKRRIYESYYSVSVKVEHGEISLVTTASK